MPRPNAARSMQSEANLARRIAYERQRRGMSFEGLAARMANEGCAMQGSAVYKIEKGDPPRRITVDELVALAAVFELAVDELLVPVELIADREVRRALDVWADARRTTNHAVDALIEATKGVFVLEALAYNPGKSKFLPDVPGVETFRVPPGLEKYDALDSFFEAWSEPLEDGASSDERVKADLMRAIVEVVRGEHRETT